MLVSVVNLTRAALVTAQPDLRRELLLDLAEREGIRVYPAEPGRAASSPLRSTGPVCAWSPSEIRRQLGADTRFAVERDGLRGVLGELPHRGRRVLGHAAARAHRAADRAALARLGRVRPRARRCSAPAFIVFRLSRPLRALIGAAARRRPGPGARAARRVRPGGDPDASSRAFNQMTRDLARLEDDRALILAGVSHDLRTPLARLRLGLEMAARDAQLKSGMTADIDEMDRIIGQFLDFARAAGGEAAGADRSGRARARSGGALPRHRSRARRRDRARYPQLAVRRLAVRRLITQPRRQRLPLRREGRAAARSRAAAGAWSSRCSTAARAFPPDEVERLKQPFTRLETGAQRQGRLGPRPGDRRAHRAHARRDPRPAGARRGGLVARVTFPLAGREIRGTCPRFPRKLVPVANRFPSEASSCFATSARRETDFQQPRALSDFIPSASRPRTGSRPVRSPTARGRTPAPASRSARVAAR